MQAATSAGIGTALSGGASQLVMNLAQELRSYAESLAQEIEVATDKSQQASVQLNLTDAIAWVSEAATNFRTALETEKNNQQDAEKSLEEAATKTRAAGESLAQQLEFLAGSIFQAGATVDALVEDIGQSAETLPEILTYGSVTSAQSHLESLLQSPLITSVQYALRAGAEA